jgi:hypothetical protein
VRIGLERELQFIEAVELGGKAVLDGLDTQADGEVISYRLSSGD